MYRSVSVVSLIADANPEGSPFMNLSIKENTAHFGFRAILMSLVLLFFSKHSFTFWTLRYTPASAAAATTLSIVCFSHCLVDLGVSLDAQDQESQGEEVPRTESSEDECAPRFPYLVPIRLLPPSRVCAVTVHVLPFCALPEVTSWEAPVSHT